MVDILVHSPESNCRPRTIRDCLLQGESRQPQGGSFLPPEGRSVSLRRMAIVNKRNAVVGFMVLKVGKIVARRKATKLKRKLPSRRKQQ